MKAENIGRVVLSSKARRQDLECLLLGKVGIAHWKIAERTGLTPYQVAYRLKAAGISTTAYRRGETELAKKVMDMAHQDSQAYFDSIASNIRKHLKEQNEAP